jgi:hypothetical protein
VDWMEIYCSSCCPKKKAGETSATGKERQDDFLNLGYCCALRLTHDSTSDGVAVPCKKPGTMQKSVVLNGFAILAAFILKTPVKLTDQNKVLFHDANSPDQQERFTTKSMRRIHSSACGEQEPTWN